MNLVDLWLPKVPLLPPPPSVAEVRMLTQDHVTTIRALRQSGMAKKRIADSLGLDVKTVRKYLEQGELVSYEREGPVATALRGMEDWFRARAPEVCFNCRVLAQEAKLKGFSGSYEAIKRFIRPLREKARSDAEATVRFETAPGVQGQVDWGSAFTWLDDKRVRVHFFVLVLGYSRRMYVRGYRGERRHNVIDGHLRAFSWFGGYPREMLYDNARTMIMTERPAGERLNKVFKDFAEHYGFEPRFCRPYRARTKGKVESGVKYVKRNFLVGRRFRDLDHLNAELEVWLREIADLRIHGTTHVAPMARFPAEQTALNPVQSVRPWQPDAEHVRHVANDGRVSFQTNRYPVPLDHAGQAVTIEGNDTEVIIRSGDQEVARHRRLPGKHQEAPCPAAFQKLTNRQPAPKADDKPRHDPRWAFEEVEVRDLRVYDLISQQQGVA